MRWLPFLLALACCATPPAPRHAVIHPMIVPMLEPAIRSESTVMLKAATRKVQSPGATTDDIYRTTALTVAMQNAVALAKRHPTQINQSAARDAIWRLRKWVGKSR